MFSNGTPPIYHFKILVPAAAAGRIIGKGGTTIAQLQKDAGARVKMSKASEFYPGTTERVCLISGPIEGILKINDFFMENFSSTSMKILVPNSTAGMIIGKGGSYIKQIKEESGAYVQISQKCTDFSLPERCVTVVGELENIRKACAMILNKIVEDVGSAFRDIRTSSITTPSITNTSITTTSSCSTTTNNNNNNNNNHSPSMFSTLVSNNVNTNTISPSSSSTTSSSSISSIGSTILDHLNPRPAPALSPPKCNQNIIVTNDNTSITPFAQSNITSPTTSNLSAMSSSVTSDMNPAQIIETIKLVLRVSGYGEDAVSEISSAMSTLASYGVLGVGLGLL